MMKFVLLLLPILSMATRYPEWFLEKLKNADLSDKPGVCNSSLCEQPIRKYTKMLPLQPGVQWNAHGGYCGAWSFQRTALSKGAYMSQQQVRDHAQPGGGHDEEILNTNIDGAFDKLHIKHDNFEFNVLPVPQADAYLKFMKKHIIAGNPLIWMVMFDGSSSPESGYTMDNKTNGIYGHVEPVVGISSDHPFTDEKVYDDDSFAYFNDADKNTYHAPPTKIPGECNFGRGQKQCRSSCPSRGQCVWNQRGYIYAILDLKDEHDAVPVSLSISPFASEPYTRGGATPIDITGTLTATGLKTGSKYDIYRWDSAEHAFVYNDTNKIKTFTATKDTYIFQDPKKFLSSSATYYRCVPSSGELIEG